MQRPRNNGTTPVARQQILNNATADYNNGTAFFYVVRAEVISETRFSAYSVYVR
jgi:hypothetical protein